ncbi:MAG: hypothetical protein A2268_07405 [Candidatus Raymondbacteria bacterium RifOxyA12_full_50_37]|uniref:Fibronectin type-III domain-containing protein n=1 Tax=Candidatus Raymondbacteria bacterium RIFOXYD12_FULL_49_13 TaxID=1817890 RepID=A0A1F7F5X4_UNCRA|nr:MAG: hypothetical protein A2268_07405 [Candidatus Raymondbacteria bacterium RifOxyA12_full_50_37]OGJ91208.1 MAG: hypothetical protein A2248_01550 [Candidatus Raymondbacteria bacterium RIFOXYA2_FULL_49_16]OGJ96155.1 MAG: hypothetical protein A2487_01565 [Candidatus Raymondbacteria bacterium RifOxyC12_full_50_8]OGJ97606.1 MAG: hypothetical protein A2453_02315 [Candidatus Raymondbacteria bacterium RIFOXYC2_FULL_50_21]OGK02064.1 MAG: hypothetical protein A2519_18760 [Candidatus Raymondbacteria b
MRFLPLLACFLLLVCGPQRHGGTLPELTVIDRFSASIEWSTANAIRGMLLYAAEGETERTITEETRTTFHHITISGLLPDKVHTYRINSGPDHTYRFRTAPGATSSFRFALIETYEKTLQQAYPDFVIITSADSHVCREIIKKYADLHTGTAFYYGTFAFTWGNSTFSSDTIIDSKSENRFLLAATQLPESADSNTALIVLDKKAPLGIDTTDQAITVHTAGTALLFEVQGPEIIASLINTASNNPAELTVRRGSLDYKKSCVYCRRLLEDRKYHESIRWYRRFMENDTATSRIDDALYQVAYIYDHYLFDYPNAVSSYQELVDRFPESSKVRTARFRISYISTHADHGFEPLKVFERARLSRFQINSEESAREVEELLSKYPGTSLEKDILFWLGNVYAPAHSEKALSCFLRLAKDSNAETAWRGGMAAADLYYRDSRYTEARQQYILLRSYAGQDRAALEIKISRCIRNARREVVRIVFLIFTLAVMLASLCIKPRPAAAALCTRFLAFLAVYAVAAALPFLIWKDFLMQAKNFTLAAIPVLAFSSTLIKERFPLFFAGIDNTVLRLCVSLAAACMFTLGIIYLLLYYFHYLFIVEGIV